MRKRDGMTKTKWYGIWHGGYSYAMGEHDDIEEFDSIADAKRTFESRCYNGLFAKQEFRYVHRPHESLYCPAVDASECRIFLYTDPDGGLPEKIISYGPRGGVKVDS